MTAPLLHLTTTADWRAVLAAGAIGPAPGDFVHLSTPAQVALPAERLFRGRVDVLALVLDPDRIGAEVRFEQGDPPHPDGMLFPHAYGPVPTSAAIAVLPYRPRPDGGFDAPPAPPGPADTTARAAGIGTSLLRRAATTEIPVTGGVAVLSDPFPASHERNQLLIDGPASPAQIVADADRVLGGRGLPYRKVQLSGSRHAGTAAELAARGWTVEPAVLMAAALVNGPGELRHPSAAPSGSGPSGSVVTGSLGVDASLTGSGPSGTVEQLGPGELRPLWDAAWRGRYPGITDGEIAQLAGRHVADDRLVDVRCLAVREAGQVVASGLLHLDGATALLGPLETRPDARRRGYADALLTEALALAGAAGCDLVALDALAEDWPRHWYARRGFAETGKFWDALLLP